MLFLVLLATGVAQAQEGDPLGGLTDANAPLDTDVTPRPKDAEESVIAAAWTHVGGARFAEPSVPQASPTSFDSDLYDVSFLDLTRCFAAGSVCQTPPVRSAYPQGGDGDRRYIEAVNACSPRVPVIYRYTDPVGAEGSWTREELPGSKDPGYVGAVAWLGPGKALAVGGTGIFMRREQVLTPAQEQACKQQAEAELTNTSNPGVFNKILNECEFAARVHNDLTSGAGTARAWLYEQGAWREITEDLPKDREGKPMRGLNTLDAIFDPPPDQPFHALAGGLAQIWYFKDRAFQTDPIDRTSPRLNDDPTNEVAHTVDVQHSQRDEFKFRVRDIRIFRLQPIQVIAVTAGCCSALRPLRDKPGFVSYHVTGSGNTGNWNYGVPNSFINPDVAGAKVNTKGYANHYYPDSIYSVIPFIDPISPSDAFSVMTFSPGGPLPPLGEREPASVLSRARHVGGVSGDDGDVTLEHLPGVTPTLDAVAYTGNLASTIRLVSGDSATLSPSDLRPDWSVGELRSTDVGIGARSLALSTEAANRPSPLAVARPCGTRPSSQMPICWIQAYARNEIAVDMDAGRASVGAMAYLLPTYALNSIEAAGPSGVYWAVGDHGAIMRWGTIPSEEEVAPPPPTVSEPDPPKLGKPSVRRLSPRSPYDDKAPPAATGEAGLVPMLSEQPHEEVGEPVIVPGSSPDPSQKNDTDGNLESVRQIIVSRDGSEGWAIGPFEEEIGFAYPDMMTLYHYDGQGWTRCDTRGYPNELSPDPACADVNALREFRNVSGSAKPHQPVLLLGAARIPYEYDDDPTNDDELGVLAIGTPYREKDSQPLAPAVIRYENGRWTSDPIADRLGLSGVTATYAHGWTRTSLALNTPTDGWALFNGNELFHYDGRGWKRCTQPGGVPVAANATECGNTAKSPLSLSNVWSARLTSAGANRVYLWGGRGISTAQQAGYPLIYVKDAGEPWRVVMDPVPPGTEAKLEDMKREGYVSGLSVAQRPDGRYEGWAVGRFGVREVIGDPDRVRRTPLLRLDPGAEEWRPWPVALNDAAYRYLRKRGTWDITGPQLVSVLPTDDEASPAYIVGPAQSRARYMLRFVPEEKRWRMMRQPFADSSQGAGLVSATAFDGEGGMWMSVQAGLRSPTYFFRLTPRVARPVFTETPPPFRDGERVTALAGGGDGSVWAGGSRGTLARYDRVTGWSTVSVVGWAIGRALADEAAVEAIALTPDGSAGVAVGEEGRIVELTSESVTLDAAAGLPCDFKAIRPPCGSSRDLIAASVAPDGSAMVGGEENTLLWRPAGDEFRAITKPPATPGVAITGVSLPTAERAWITTSSGLLYGGRLIAGRWIWVQENVKPNGGTMGQSDMSNVRHVSNDGRNNISTFLPPNQPLPLEDIAVDASGHGYAVGERGLILQRTGDGDQPWRRLRTGSLDNLRSIVLPAGGGEGALLGSEAGGIFRLDGTRLAIARPPTIWHPVRGSITSLALVPGIEPGQVEAWAAIRQDGIEPTQLLHYGSPAGGQLLQPPEMRVAPAPDVPTARPGEVALAAFGKAGCDFSPTPCEEHRGSLKRNDRVLTSIVEDISSANLPVPPDLAVFTGDVLDSGGVFLGAAMESSRPTASPPPVAQAAFSELVVDPLAVAGVPLYAAIGTLDLAESGFCQPRQSGQSGQSCNSFGKSSVPYGENLAWRSGFADRPAPWGSGPPATTPEFVVRPVPDSLGSRRVPDFTIEDQTGWLRDQKIPLSGASTHYALDLLERGSGRPALRLVVVDTSMGSLSGGDPAQQPLEQQGQLRWLEGVLCFRGQERLEGEPCTREPGQPAAVVSTSPTYSYGRTKPEQQHVGDAVALEQLMFDHDVAAVISGRLGWNGLYWALAPGLHYPTPGTSYTERAPDPLPGQPAPIPFAVASGAGGPTPAAGAPKAIRDQESAEDGFWHGFSIVRVHPSGDPAKTIVEQRPALTWVSLAGPTNVVRPNEKVMLDGLGLGPVPIAGEAKYLPIGTQAITHRYDLVYADPQEPWLPLTDEKAGSMQAAEADAADASSPLQPDGPDRCGQYLCLDDRVATIDRDSGTLRAGAGEQNRTFAIALLSVGSRAATWPLVFEPRPTFRAPPPPPPSALPPAPPPTPTPPPPAQPPPSPDVPTVSTPPGPPVVPLAPLDIGPPPPPAAPPLPPSEPPAQIALQVHAGVEGIDVVPLGSVFPPPAPPIQPAPPSGARREARQRQAATQKSGADAKETKLDGVSDTAQSSDTVPGSQSMTRTDHSMSRRAQVAPGRSFTALTGGEQPSAWARGALWGGGMMLGALLLALGYRTLRPTPRYRQPDSPAPAWGRNRGWPPRGP